MWQPRSNFQVQNLKERFSVPRYYSTESPQEPHRSQSRRLVKEKKMSGALPADPMDVDSSSTDRNAFKDGRHGETFLEDEKVEEQFEMVHHETLGETPSYTHPNKSRAKTCEMDGMQQKVSEIQGLNKVQQDANTPQGDGESNPKENSGRVAVQETKVEDIDRLNLQSQFQQLRKECEGKMSILCSKVTDLETSALRQPSIIEGRQPSDDAGLSPNLKQKYEDRIATLEKTAREMEEQIHNLLNSQEPVMKYQTELEARYRAAVNHIEKEKRAREESDLNLRSEITTIRGSYQKEKERAQKLIKTMAEMQSADPFKMDNTSITSLVKELRYDIKNWAWAQRLLPSLPAQGLISTYTSRALGGRERGPNYEFLKEISPFYHEYTESSQDFRWLLQAYIWKRIVDMIFYEDLWAGTRKPLDEEETEYRLQTGYRLMKMRLTPTEDETSEDYITQFHTWRATTSRLLAQRTSPERHARTLTLLRDEILRPLYKAVPEPSLEPQELRNLEDLDSVLESAMRLGASMAQQRAYFTFEFVSTAAYGKMEFRQADMTDPFPAPEHFDQRSQCRAVWLNLAPRLMKHGTSEGTGFQSCVQLLEGEVETRVVPRRFAGRRQGGG